MAMNSNYSHVQMYDNHPERVKDGDNHMHIPHQHCTLCSNYALYLPGATQNFREFEYTAQTISITNLRR
jgi:hypothetical protein